MLKYLELLDKKLNYTYDKAQKSFIVKIILKLISEIVLACLIALSLYFATSLYNDAVAISTENKKLNQLYITMSDKYCTDLFGEPYISIEENGLTNNFYVLDATVLRTVVDEGNLVAYFITAKETKKISSSSAFKEKITLGKTTYLDMSFPNPEFVYNNSVNGRYTYYGEIQGTGRYGMFNYYICGALPYGFFDECSSELIYTLSFEQDKNSRIKELREKCKPNTVGVISQQYHDNVTFIPIWDEGENVYYLLNKN